MQKWEYKTVMRTRGVKDREGNTSLHKASAWDVEIAPMLPQLGEEGWELVAISTRSSAMGGMGWRDKQSATDYPISPSLDFAGFTSDELWVFKRPKP